MSVQCTTDVKPSALVALIDEVCGESEFMATARFSPTPDWVRALQEPEGKDYRLIVAKIQGETVGWCRLFPTGTKGEAELGIGVDKAWRNQGIGTAMMTEAVRWAKERDHLRLVLYSHHENFIAHHLFGNFSFRLSLISQSTLKMQLDLDQEEEYGG
jgi:RimJ/RimL family protein N-acetyltransferase